MYRIKYVTLSPLLLALFTYSWQDEIQIPGLNGQLAIAASFVKLWKEATGDHATQKGVRILLLKDNTVLWDSLRLPAEGEFYVAEDESCLDIATQYNLAFQKDINMGHVDTLEECRKTACGRLNERVLFFWRVGALLSPPPPRFSLTWLSNRDRVCFGGLLEGTSQ